MGRERERGSSYLEVHELLLRMWEPLVRKTCSNNEEEEEELLLIGVG